MNGGSAVGEQRSALAVIGETFRLYRRYPLLFFALAAGVIWPYEAILVAATGTGPAGQSAGLGFLLTVLDFGFVTPLISALHVHAVLDVREGREPRILLVARQGLRVLPVVAAASIVATLGMFVGFLLLVVPGVILWLRWFVVAQAAAVEQEGWLPALRRSAELVSGNYGYVFLVVLCLVLVGAPAVGVQLAFGAHSTAAVALLVTAFLRTLIASFTALAGAVLYFDLRARLAARLTGAPATGLDAGWSATTAQESWDPRVHSDAERPRGWYVDPASPHRMHYWGGPGADGWVGKARTPGKVRRAWEVEVGVRAKS